MSMARAWGWRCRRPSRLRSPHRCAAAEIEFELEIQDAAGQVGVLGSEIEHVVGEIRVERRVGVERLIDGRHPFANDFERDGIAARQSDAGDRRIQPADEQIVTAELRCVESERELALIVLCGSESAAGVGTA